MPKLFSCFQMVLKLLVSIKENASTGMLVTQTTSSTIFKVVLCFSYAQYQLSVAVLKKLYQTVTELAVLEHPTIHVLGEALIKICICSFMWLFCLPVFQDSKMEFLFKCLITSFPFFCSGQCCPGSVLSFLPLFFQVLATPAQFLASAFNLSVAIILPTGT